MIYLIDEVCQAKIYAIGRDSSILCLHRRGHCEYGIHIMDAYSTFLVFNNNMKTDKLVSFITNAHAKLLEKNQRKRKTNEAS